MLLNLPGLPLLMAPLTGAPVPLGREVDVPLGMALAMAGPAGPAAAWEGTLRAALRMGAGQAVGGAELEVEVGAVSVPPRVGLAVMVAPLVVAAADVAVEGEPGKPVLVGAEAVAAPVERDREEGELAPLVLAEMSLAGAVMPDVSTPPFWMPQPMLPPSVAGVVGDEFVAVSSAVVATRPGLDDSLDASDQLMGPDTAPEPLVRSLARVVPGVEGRGVALAGDGQPLPPPPPLPEPTGSPLGVRQVGVASLPVVLAPVANPPVLFPPVLIPSASLGPVPITSVPISVAPMVPVAASSVENATVVVPDAVPGVARVVSATAMAENVARAVTGEAEFQTVVMRDPVASVAPGPRPDRVGGVDLAPVALAADPVRGALAVVSAVPVTAVARPLVRRVDERAAGVDAVAPAGRPFRVGEVVADAVRPGDSDVTGEVAARPGVVEPAPEWHAAQMAGQPPAMPAREEGRAPLAGGGPHVAAGDAGLRPVLADEEVPAPLRQFAAALAESPGDGGEGERHVRLRLRPASLGELDVRITSGLDDGARVAIAATRPETLSLLRADMAGLRQTLAEAGLHVSEANLTFVLRPAEALAAPADPAPGLGGHLPDVGVEAARPATPATGPNLGPNLGSHLDQGMRAQNDFGFGQGGNADPGARRFGQHPATPRGAEAGAAWDEPIVATSPSPGRSGGGLDITA